MTFWFPGQLVVLWQFQCHSLFQYILTYKISISRTMKNILKCKGSSSMKKGILKKVWPGHLASWNHSTRTISVKNGSERPYMNIVYQNRYFNMRMNLIHHKRKKIPAYRVMTLSCSYRSHSQTSPVK